MSGEKVCPCPNLECPNHGNCRDCSSRHLRMGTLSCCAFYSILPELEAAVAASPDSPSAELIRNRIESQTAAYRRLLEKHCISQETFAERRAAKTRVSSH